MNEPEEKGKEKGKGKRVAPEKDKPGQQNPSAGPKKQEGGGDNLSQAEKMAIDKQNEEAKNKDKEARITFETVPPTPAGIANLLERYKWVPENQRNIGIDIRLYILHVIRELDNQEPAIKYLKISLRSFQNEEYFSDMVKIYKDLSETCLIGIKKIAFEIISRVKLKELVRGKADKIENVKIDKDNIKKPITKNPDDEKLFGRKKGDYYKLFTQSLRWYIPHFLSCTAEFLSMLASGEKLAIPISNLKVCDVPNYRELSMESFRRFWFYPDVAFFVPDVRFENFRDRTYFFNVINTLYPGSVQKTVNEDKEARIKHRTNDIAMGIPLDPEVAEALQKEVYVHKGSKKTSMTKHMTNKAFCKSAGVKRPRQKFEGFIAAGLDTIHLLEPATKVRKPNMGN